jgi:hypothetical protein
MTFEQHKVETLAVLSLVFSRDIVAGNIHGWLVAPSLVRYTLAGKNIDVGS